MKIFIFSGLKIAEISSIWFIPYYLGRWNPFGVFESWANGSLIEIWTVGFQTMLLVALGAVVFILVCLAIYGNWQGAKKLDKKMDR